VLVAWALQESPRRSEDSEKAKPLRSAG